MIDNIKNYTKNGKCWLIGDFLPSIIKTDKFEVGIHSHKKNEPTESHFHLKTKEINVIISGKMRVGNDILSKDDIFVFVEGQISDVNFLEDTVLLVIRNGSFPNDKYIL